MYCNEYMIYEKQRKYFLQEIVIVYKYSLDNLDEKKQDLEIRSKCYHPKEIIEIVARAL